MLVMAIRDNSARTLSGSERYLFLKICKDFYSYGIIKFIKEIFNLLNW